MVGQAMSYPRALEDALKAELARLVTELDKAQKLQPPGPRPPPTSCYTIADFHKPPARIQ